MRNRDESGFAMITALTLLVPLLLLAGSFASAMLQRNRALQGELDEEIALLAAEAGIDKAIHLGRLGKLSDGLVVSRDLGWGQSFKLEATYLMADGVDNDNDVTGDIDEPDEDVFQVIVTGTYRQASRRVAAYLGPVPLLPTLGAAFVSQDPDVELDLNGTSLVSGFDVNVDGTPGPGPDAPAIATAPPGSIAHLDSELNASEEMKVQGAGGTPSLGIGPVIDVADLSTQLRNIADNVLTSKVYSNYDFGDATAGTSSITYREGNVRMTGDCRGAGILVVTGDLMLSGTFRFDGVVIVLGSIVAAAGTADIYGAVLQGADGDLLQVAGTLDVHYSSQAIAIANSTGGRYVSFNGWQELSSR